MFQVAVEDEDIEVGAGEGDAGGEWDGPPVNEVNPMGVHEIGEAGRAADAGDTNDFLVRNAEFLDHIEEGGEDGKVSAGRAPCGVVGLQLLLGELFGGRSGIGHGKKC